MRPLNLLHLYRIRLRSRLLQELFALAGIAAGVALLFASQIAASSLSGSVETLNEGIVGRATLQLSARSAQGFPQTLVKRVRTMQGVKVAAPLLEANGYAAGPGGGASVQLIGAGPALKALGGALVRRTNLDPFAGFGAVVLPAPLARSVGVTKFGQKLTLHFAGRTSHAGLYRQLHAKTIGPLTSSPLVIAPLRFAQEVAGTGRRVSRILVQPDRGQTAAVRARLLALAAGRLNVESASYETRLFALASEATNESTTLFAAISALVGFLFAFNAVLLTVPQRRRLIAELRRDGYPPRSVISVLALDALLLGLAASVLGLGLGDEISMHLLHSTPGYLSSAFAIGGQRVVTWQSAAISIAGGLLAAAVAVLSPLRDVISRDPLAAIVPRPLLRKALPPLPLLAGALLLAATAAILLLAPQLAIVGMLTAVASLLLLLPLPLAAGIKAVGRLARRLVGAVPHVATMELTASRSKALAIAATGAIAVFGAVAIEGARGDLLSGLEAAASETDASNDVWAAPTGSGSRLLTTPFAPTALRRLKALPGVRSVRLYRGALLDVGDRRAWVIAPSAAARPLLPAGQIVEGDAATATRRLRAGGWVVVSEAIAGELHLHLGERFTLPSPAPERLRVAAISTNVGWAPGAIMLTAEEYAKAWGSADASAYSILASEGVPPERVASEVRGVLGGAFHVQTASHRAQALNAVSRSGLARLSQIATLIVIAAALAIAAAIGAMIWQRRPRLAKLKLEGFSRGELWRTLLLESAILAGAGCLAGALLGLLGRQLLDRALAHVVGYPVLPSIGASGALLGLALVASAAVAVVAVPGWLAARVPVARALED